MHGHRVTVITLSDRDGELFYKKGINVIRVKRTVLDPLKDDLTAAVCMLENSWKLYKAVKEVKRKVVWISYRAQITRRLGFSGIINFRRS